MSGSMAMAGSSASSVVACEDRWVACRNVVWDVRFAASDLLAHAPVPFYLTLLQGGVHHYCTGSSTQPQRVHPHPPPPPDYFPKPSPTVRYCPPA
jgi:hypothetical protein